MVKREELVECIYFDGHEWSCPTSGENCELVDCKECASNILAEYEQKIRADAIDDVIKKLAESEDTLLTDKQYYALMELKEQANE